MPPVHHTRRYLPLVLLAVGLPLFGASSEIPPPAGAYIQKLAAHPHDDDVLYAATNGSGLYRSTEAGDSWENISVAPDLRHYNIVVFDPTDPDRIFTGGRESGLWESADAGDSWTRIAFTDTSILSLVIDPRDPQKLLLLTPDGVHRTTTGPAGPWQHVFDYPRFVAEEMAVPWPNPDWAVRLGRFQHLTLDPHDPDRIYLGARWEGGYHQSDDGGMTWTHEAIGPIFRRGDRIVVDPVDPQILYAETHHQGMFKSYNRGRSWVSSSEGIAPQKRTPHYGAVLISGSAFAPHNSQVIYAGSDYSNWKSSDAGATWEEVGRSLTCEFARSFLVTSQAVYAGTNVGIYRSFDGGATWEPCNRGLPTREILAMTTGTVDGAQFEFAVVKGRPAVFRRSTDAHADWVSTSWMLYENASAVRFEEATETVVITTPNGERRSDDGGLRWDVPPTVYETKPLLTPAATAASPYAVTVAIHGAPAPDDSLVDSWYQRPPYVALAIVGPGYPTDGSEPLWTSHWADQLVGTIEVPDALIGSILRVEVRDFQYGTRVGETSLQRDQPNVIEVNL
jgi:photosystem II stability/assembly factor-like uncharacterized protein